MASIPGLALGAIQPTSPSGKPIANPKLRHLLDHAQRALSAGQLQQALIDLQLAIGIEPGNAGVRAQLGIAYLEGGQYDDAEEQLRYARSRGAPDDVILGPLFEAMLALGENQPLLDLYAEPALVEHSPLAATILRARAAAMQALGDDAGASRTINRALSIRRDLGAVLTAAHIALVQNQWTLASGLADEALRLSPNSTDVLVFKVDAALMANDQARALAIAERMVADKPNSLAARLARINAYLATGNTDKAKPDVDLILAQTPNMLVAMYYRAIILARHNNFAAAWSVAHSLPAEFVQSRSEVAINVADMAAGAGFLESGATILGAAVLKIPESFGRTTEACGLSSASEQPAIRAQRVGAG